LHQPSDVAQQGGSAVQFLVQKFTIFGVELQNWMPIVVFLIVSFIIFAWRARDF